MPRLIDVNKQLVRLYRLHLFCEDTIKQFLISADTVDAEPVRHGHWITQFDDLFPMESTIECSICGEKEWMMTIINHNYCPHCGAKMDEEEEDRHDVR